MRFKSLFAVIILILAIVGSAHHAASQMRSIPGSGSAVKKVTIPNDLTPAQIDKLLGRLNDTQVRQLLRERLNIVAQNKTRNQGVIADFWTNLESGAKKFRARLPVMVAGLSEFPGVLATALTRLGGNKGTVQLIILLLETIAAFLIGWLADLVYRRLIRSRRQKIYDIPADAAWPTRVWGAVVRLILGVGSIAVFALFSALAFIAFFSESETARLFFKTYFAAIIGFRVVGLIGRFVFSPYSPGTRFENMTDDNAIFVYKWLLWIAGVSAFGLATCKIMDDWGLGQDPHFLMLIAVGLAAMTLLIYAVWKSREIVSAAIHKSADSSTGLSAYAKHLSADLWPILAIAYILIIHAIWVFELVVKSEFKIGALFISLLLPPIVAITDRGIKRAVLHRFNTRATASISRPDDAADEEASSVDDETSGRHEYQRNRYGLVFHRVLRLLILIATILVLLGVWGVNLFTSLENSVGAKLAGAVIDVIIVILVFYVIWEIARAWFDRRMAEEDADTPEELKEEGGEGGGIPKTRMATLLPLFRGFILSTLVAMAVMIMLSNLGVDIGPLLAGAGIVGVAIGFGSQTLVRDIVSGAFFLIDDAFRVGEYVETGDLRGTVEKLSIRSMQMRHHRGLVHTIPYGEIKSITNFSRDWVIMKLEFRLPYGTDSEKVRKLIKRTGQEMAADPELAKGMLAPLKSQGVSRMEDSALIFRAKFTAKPGEQFVLRREAYRRIQDVLIENGIAFAHNRVTVEVAGNDKTGFSDEELASAGGAGLSTAQKPA